MKEGKRWKAKLWRSLFDVYGYKAIIPHIQNIYPPEKDAGIWMFGFKYTGGVFEFFHYKTYKETKDNYRRLAKEIDDYWKEVKWVVKKKPREKESKS